MKTYEDYPVDPDSSDLRKKDYYTALSDAPNLPNDFALQMNTEETKINFDINV